MVPDTQVTALQGMGKEIAPRIVKLSRKSKTAVLPRDINGFNAALKYAADAIKVSPKIELGTGEGGSGVGITVNAGVSAPAAPAAAPAAAAAPAGKRDAKLKTTVTTMFVRGGPVPANSGLLFLAIVWSAGLTSKARNVDDKIEKRTPTSDADGVNLNMAEGQVAELTFVETRSADDEA